MAVGAKLVETRHWSTRYRGLVLIHAAMRLDRTELSMLEERPEWIAALRPAYPTGSLADVLPFGKLVAVGRLVDCFPTERLAAPTLYTQRTHPGEPTYPHWTESDMGNFARGRFGWVFEDLEPIPTMPWKGAQGLFDIPDWKLKGCIPDKFLDPPW